MEVQGSGLFSKLVAITAVATVIYVSISTFWQNVLTTPPLQLMLTTAKDFLLRHFEPCIQGSRPVAYKVDRLGCQVLLVHRPATILRSCPAPEIRYCKHRLTKKKRQESTRLTSTC